MNEHRKAIAATCLAAAEGNTMAFPAIVGMLMQAGFESYAIDFRRASATYYLPDGDSIALAAHRVEAPIAPAFDVAGMRAAIREAQQQSPGYTYRGFCEKAALAGCAGYIVSFSGRRALYVGRTAETHVEPFPDR
ncbi:MAG: DUF1398 family protein [Rhodospirillales bacterium]|nr:DUF1398 family protein [Rhodospirillales bacterium]